MSNSLINIDPLAKVGMRIRMKEMSPDEVNPVDEDLEGTIDKIDDIGTLHVKWDDGRYIGVIPNVDKYELLPNLEDQIDFDVFESTSDFKVSKDAKKSEMGKKVSKSFKRELSKAKPKSDIKIESEENIDETMTAGGVGGLAGASGYAYTPSLGYKNPKVKESHIIKGSTFLNEMTNTGSISSTVDFLITNLMGWGTISDMSPPWPSFAKKADNGKNEDWWWQNIPTYNGGVITDPYSKTDEVWDDDKLSVDIEQDINLFRKDIDKNPKKYKQTVITTNKGFDVNIDPVNNDWKSSLQKGVNLKTTKSEEPLQTFRNKVSPRSVKKEEISLFTDNLINEVKNKKEDIEETTTFSSVFGSDFPVTPTFAAKKGKHIPSKKPIWKGGKIVQNLNESNLLDEINKIKWVKGGKFIKIKDKCSKYNNQPWCSQGAIDNPIELSDNTFEAIKNISDKTGLSEEYILNKITKNLGL